MFARLEPDQTDEIELTVDGRAVTARAGDTVAAVLLAAGISELRASAVSGRPRGPYCMMGVCFECLVTVDGLPDRQACMVTAAHGMEVRTTTGTAHDI